MSGTIDLTFALEMVGTVAFAISGAMIAIQKRLDLLGILVLGITTAVGGGMIRDMMAQQIPFILVKQIYACASLAGAGVCIWLMPYHKSASMILGAVVVVIIRILAATYRWDLPKID